MELSRLVNSKNLQDRRAARWMVKTLADPEGNAANVSTDTMADSKNDSKLSQYALPESCLEDIK